MTTDELVAFPDDGFDRWLIAGELRSRVWEHRTPATSSAITNVGCALSNWTRIEKPNRGTVLVDAYHRLAREPDTTVGIDVSLISKHQSDAARHKPFVEGYPILAIKVISPSDTVADVSEPVHEYLGTGVSIVWVVDPDFQTVCVYRANIEPELYNRADELSAEPHLPGFRVRVAELFE